MTMPAGIYYVGDLCYVMDDEWNEVCDIIFDEGNLQEGEFMLLGGRKFSMFGTKWGDGSYNDQKGNTYLVDSGTIGAILLSDIDLKNKKNDIDGGNIISFKTDFDCSGGGNNSKWNGIIRIGNILIDTGEEEADW